MRVTMKHVAKCAGVAHSVVSKVFANSKGNVRVSEETAERIRRIAKELKYIPNTNASSLRRGRSQRLLVLIPEVYNPCYVENFNAIQKYAREFQFEEMLQTTEWETAREISYCRELAAIHGSGLIILSPGDNQKAEHLLQLEASGIPVLSLTPIEHEGVTAPISYLTMRRDTGLRQLIRHLVELGHRWILYAGAMPLDVFRTDDRYLSILAGLRENGLDADALVYGLVPSDAQGQMSAIQAHLSASPRPTAVIAQNDHTALAILSGVYRMGLRVPHDVSVAGLDNIRLAETACPPLTSVGQDLSRLGRRSLEIIAERLATPGLPPHAEWTESYLVVRESTGPARA